MSTTKDSMYYLSGESHGLQPVICTTVGYQDCEPHGSYPVSSHPDLYNFSTRGRVLDEYQMVYITHGEGWFESDSCHRTRIRTGDVIILFPGERHIYHPDEKVGWHEYWIGFKGNGEFDASMKSMYDKADPVQHIGIDDRVLYIYETVMGLAHFERKDNQKAMMGWIGALVMQVEYDRTNFDSLHKKHNQTVLDAQILLREHLHEHISPGEVAKRLGVSYSLLREQFRATTGMSMANYALQQRLNKSKMLLANTGKSIKEISYSVGYDSISRFCCFFKEHLGITASEYRANAIKEK